MSQSLRRVAASTEAVVTHRSRYASLSSPDDRRSYEP